MSSLRTVQADDAHQVATRDRSATADLLLGLAIREVIDLIRGGHPGRARFRLTRAGMAAERITGTAPVGRGTVWTLNGVTSHTCGWGCAPTPVACCWAGERKPHTFNDGVCIWCHTVEQVTP